MQCIDISSAERRRSPAFDALLANLHAAASSDGHFLREGHGLPRKVVSKARQAVESLFARSRWCRT